MILMILISLWSQKANLSILTQLWNSINNINNGLIQMKNNYFRKTCLGSTSHMSGSNTFLRGILENSGYKNEIISNVCTSHKNPNYGTGRNANNIVICQWTFVESWKLLKKNNTGYISRKKCIIISVQWIHSFRHQTRTQPSAASTQLTLSP